MRKAFAFAGVDESFTSEQFDREWEKSSAKQGDKYQFMEKLIKLPGFRSFDRNFDRLPESMRWLVEKVVHDPEKPPAPKPKLPDDLFETVRGRFGEDVAALQSSPAASSPAGTTTPEPRSSSRLAMRLPPRCGGCSRPRPDHGRGAARDATGPGRRRARSGRFVAVNFAATVDGRATIGGVSGPIGSATDTAMLVGLRSRFDAVMIGAGTKRAEGYDKTREAADRGREHARRPRRPGRSYCAPCARSAGSGPCSARAARRSTAPCRRTAWSTSSS